MINENEYIIFGMRRSGNHMVVSAIMSCFGTNEIYYFNDVCEPGRLFIELAKAQHSASREKFPVLAEKLVKREMYSPANITKSKKKCLIQTYEDKPLTIIDKINRQNIGVSQKKYKILILRDCFNWLASRLEHVKKHRVAWTLVNSKTIALWKQYAKEYLGETNYLGENKILINYNRFAVDKNYQKEIANKLNIKYECMNLDAVLAFGRGSSFSSTKHVANKNCYNERWKLFKDNPKFKELINDKELQELSNKIFGPIYSI